MEVETVAAEIKYTLKVPSLSSYSEGNELFTEFPMSVCGLRSRWGVKIQPFLSSKPNKPHHINSDIGITLSCLRTNITNPDIDIYCSVVGRGKEHECKLELVKEEEEDGKAPLRRTWQGVLVPRLALHVYDLLPHDQLTAILRFVIRTDDVWGNNDPLEELSAQIAHTAPSQSTFPVHFIPKSPLRTDRVTSARSGARVTVTSPGHPRTPSHPTGQKHYDGKGFSSASGDKRPYSPSKFSPSKRPSPKVTQDSPCRRILQWEDQVPRSRQASSFPQLSCDSVNSSTSSSAFSKSPLKELELNIQRSPGRGRTVKVNMSASVAEAMLDWIYMGECSDLAQLAKPLLVAGKRHGVEGLVVACEQHLAATLTPATAPHTLLLAHKYSADSLCSATMKYAVSQGMEVTSQPSWATVASRSPALMTKFSRLLALHAHPGRKR
ncbi:hypothetical protein O3P69_014722 [Scylla paramamosain]|uniref:BTB domain-containing protein n=1 Tax=Scylla paramamosain TaxID=85552 RepID=A0AAW0TZ05_SCYPA